MCVLPEKQRQGIGGKLMEWGLKKMDERDIEGFVEASGRGRLLYRKFGFLDVAYVRVNMDHEDLRRTESWRDLERASLPIDYTAMWRPRQGNLPAAEVKQIWQERLKTPVRAHVEELI
jgi:GNAT superfamily N-acetyltransferase